MSDTNKTTVDGEGRRRRLPLPVQAAVHLDETLAANDRHPLGQSSPLARTTSRVRLIAAVLVRLARTDLARLGRAE